MTPPKDKAIETVDKIYEAIEYRSLLLARKLAAISQQEKIDLLEVLDKEMQSILGSDGYEERDFITAHLEYEIEVKSEIEKL